MTFSEFKNIYFNLSEEEKNHFIKNRIQELLDNSKQVEIGIDLCGSYNGFISPQTELSSNPIFPNLKFDDFYIYSDFLNYIDNDVNKINKEPKLINELNNYIMNYFGPCNNNLFDRMQVYDTKDWEALSVKELKGKNIAACSERSALAQNILKFLGLESEIVFGKLNNDESHAYIIFKPEKSSEFRILFDPMNPCFFKDKNNEYTMGVSIIKNDDYLKLKNGEEINFSYDLVKKLFNNEVEFEEDKRIYTCDDIKFKREKHL